MRALNRNRMQCHVAVRSSPATYGKCNVPQFGGSWTKVVRRHQTVEKPECELFMSDCGYESVWERVREEA